MTTADDTPTMHGRHIQSTRLDPPPVGMECPFCDGGVAYEFDSGVLVRIEPEHVAGCAWLAQKTQP